MLGYIYRVKPIHVTNIILTKNTKGSNSKLHHWWPQGVSRRWVNDEGFIYQMFSDGRDDIPQRNAKNFGAIGRAHSIKFAKEPTAFDECYEKIFDRADKAFPDIIDWLNNLKISQEQFFINFDQEDDGKLDVLLECLLSLVIRSPRFRNSIKLGVEVFGVDATETVIKLNQRDVLDKFINNLKGRGRFGILVSEGQEFIYGDGFYNNFSSSLCVPMNPRIMVPLLPDVCVIYSCPMEYMRYPRLVSVAVCDEEVDFINKTTMTYSRDLVFYRSQRPEPIDDFLCKQHLEYQWNGDPVINSFNKIFS